MEGEREGKGRPSDTARKGALIDVSTYLREAWEERGGGCVRTSI